jgi:hypothetical protein
MSKLKYVAFVFFLHFFLSCKKGDTCNCNQAISATDKYVYPILPGSIAWDSIGKAGGIDSIYKICQIPINTIQTMSTLGLIQSLLDNPSLTNILLRYNLFQGRDEVLRRLNVSCELNKRADASKWVLVNYKSKDPLCIKCIGNATDKGKFVSSFTFFDILCTQDSILNQLSIIEKKQFGGIIINQYNSTINISDFGGLKKITTMLLLSQIMISASFQPYLDALQTDQSLSSFSQGSTAVTSNILDKVFLYSNQFIN